MKQDYYTPRELAKRLRVDYTTVMHWIRSGILESEKIQQGNRHRIKKASIESLETPSTPVR
jgi:excisionase family DNA binding protein